MAFDLESNDPITPLLRWAGGKQQILKKLAVFLPSDVRDRRYFEPFAGAASLFLAIKPHSGYLADANNMLINCYKCIRNKPRLINKYLRKHLRYNSEKYYYQIRSVFNETQNISTAQAARFIYLNKACFNGIYRVNQKGEFNVPYGHKEPPAIPSRNTLLAVSAAFEQVELINASYEDISTMVHDGDFVYLDPPYPPLNGTSYFTHYTPERFNYDDHTRLAQVFLELSNRGCLVMMSNADTPRIRELFRGFNFSTLNVIRYISCKSIKHKVREIVVTNY